MFNYADRTYTPSQPQAGQQPSTGNQPAPAVPPYLCAPNPFELPPVQSVSSRTVAQTRDQVLQLSTATNVFELKAKTSRLMNTLGPLINSTSKQQLSKLSLFFKNLGINSADYLNAIKTTPATQISDNLIELIANHLNLSREQAIIQLAAIYNTTGNTALATAIQTCSLEDIITEATTTKADIPTETYTNYAKSAISCGFFDSEWRTKQLTWNGLMSPLVTAIEQLPGQRAQESDLTVMDALRSLNSSLRQTPCGSSNQLHQTFSIKELRTLTHHNFNTSTLLLLLLKLTPTAPLMGDGPELIQTLHQQLKAIWDGANAMSAETAKPIKEMVACLSLEIAQTCILDTPSQSVSPSPPEATPTASPRDRYRELRERCASIRTGIESYELIGPHFLRANMANCKRDSIKEFGQKNLSDHQFRKIENDGEHKTNPTLVRKYFDVLHSSIFCNEDYPFQYLYYAIQNSVSDEEDRAHMLDGLANNVESYLKKHRRH